jgi:hypothetical protein
MTTLRPANLTAASPRRSDLPPGVTREDVDAARTLQDRKRYGEYFLADDDPLHRKIMEANISNLVSQIASANQEDLGRVFADLGLDVAASSQLQSHQAKISSTALKADSAISQLLTARSDYDQRVRSLLPEEKYSQYRLYEDLKLARNELGNIQNYAQQQGIPTDAAYQATLLTSLYQAKAYSVETELGPYDGIPQPTVGKAGVIAYSEQQIARISESAGQLAKMASESALPDSYKSLLENYFQNRVQGIRDFVDIAKKPDEVAIKQMNDYIARESQNRAKSSP